MASAGDSQLAKQPHSPVNLSEVPRLPSLLQRVARKTVPEAEVGNGGALLLSSLTALGVGKNMNEIMQWQWGPHPSAGGLCSLI